jgi:hypothetical protein
VKSFNLRASTDDIEEAEGMTGEFVLTEDHERALSASRENNQALQARLDASKVAYDELRAAVDAIPTTTLRFWLATRHIEGFDPATEFCRLALKLRGDRP